MNEKEKNFLKKEFSILKNNYQLTFMEVLKLIYYKKFSILNVIKYFFVKKETIVTSKCNDVNIILKITYKQFRDRFLVLKTELWK